MPGQGDNIIVIDAPIAGHVHPLVYDKPTATTDGIWVGGCRQQRLFSRWAVVTDLQHQAGDASVKLDDYFPAMVGKPVSYSVVYRLYQAGDDLVAVAFRHADTSAVRLNPLAGFGGSSVCIRQLDAVDHAERLALKSLGRRFPTAAACGR